MKRQTTQRLAARPLEAIWPPRPDSGPNSGANSGSPFQATISAQSTVLTGPASRGPLKKGTVPLGNSAPYVMRYSHFALFNRDSEDIPASRRKPILAGMSGEERVSVARRALLFESRLNDSTVPFFNRWRGLRCALRSVMRILAHRRA